MSYVNGMALRKHAITFCRIGKLVLIYDINRHEVRDLFSFVIVLLTDLKKYYLHGGSFL